VSCSRASPTFRDCPVDRPDAALKDKSTTINRPGIPDINLSRNLRALILAGTDRSGAAFGRVTDKVRNNPQAAVTSAGSEIFARYPKAPVQ